MSVQLFGERWNPRLTFDARGRSSLFWEDNMFRATERCGGLSVTEKNSLFSAWEAALTEPVSSQRDGVAVFYSPSRLYAVGSVEELDDRPLLRQAVETTLRIGISQYGGRFRKFIESHPLGVLDVFPNSD